MDKYLFAINGHDFVTKMYDFRNTFVLECVHIEYNAFRKDILNSWSYHIKTI